MKQAFSRKNQSGFSLIETLIAVLVFSAAFVVLARVVSTALLRSRASQELTQAQQLAQEGLELVHQVRDTNLVSGQPWLENLGPCVSNEGCMIAPDHSDGEFSITGCSGDCDPLHLPSNADSGFISHLETGGELPYVRTITISEDAAPGAQITSTVSWASGVVPRSVSFSSYITPWQN